MMQSTKGSSQARRVAGFKPLPYRLFVAFSKSKNARSGLGSVLGQTKKETPP
jgi:hypothetical protein